MSSVLDAWSSKNLLEPALQGRPRESEAGRSPIWELPARRHEQAGPRGAEAEKHRGQSGASLIGTALKPGGHLEEAEGGGEPGPHAAKTAR